MAAATSVPIEYLDEIIECPICCEAFTDPRELPCVHTYCLKCIREWCKNLQKGDNGSCPQCRREFQIPEHGGIDELPKNIFVSKFLHVKHVSLSQDKTKLGDICEKHPDKYMEMYCFPCKALACMMCYIDDHNGHKCSDVTKVSDEFKSRFEQNMKDLKGVIDDFGKKCDVLEANKVDFQKQINEAEARVSETVKRLKKLVRSHEQKVLDELKEIRKNRLKEIEILLQNVAKERATLASFEKYVRELLSKGTASDITRQADSLTKRFSELMNIDETDKLANQLGTIEVSFQESDMINHGVSPNIVGKTVVKKSSARQTTALKKTMVEPVKKTMVEQESARKITMVEQTTKAELIQSLDEGNEIGDRMEQLRELRARIERYRADLFRTEKESLVAYTEQVRDKGTPCDVAQQSSTLHIRASELSNLHDKQPAAGTSSMDVTFRGALGISPLAKRVFGSIRNRVKEVKAELIHSLDEGNAIGGLTTLKNQLFVYYGGDSHLTVYDTETYRVQRKVTLPGVGGVVDMTSCKIHECVYISDGINNVVHRIMNNDTITQWPVNDNPQGISMNSVHNVLVTCVLVSKIKEFTFDGNLVRVITLQNDIKTPWHSIQLTPDSYVVCHGDVGDELHRVCIVDSVGHVRQSYGGRNGSGEGQLCVPCRLALRANIYVSDINNHRVVMLSGTLSYIGDVVSGLRYPNRIWFDEQTARLYVADVNYENGEWVSGCVRVYKV